MLRLTMAGMNSRLYLNKQQVAFIIHPKQNNKYPNINKQCREIARIQNKTMYLLHSYLRVPFSGNVLFPSNASKSLLKSHEKPHPLQPPTSLIRFPSQAKQCPQKYLQPPSSPAAKNAPPPPWQWKSLPSLPKTTKQKLSPSKDFCSLL